MRCDASPAVGFGHVVRSLALARELAGRGAVISFAMREDRHAEALVRRDGYPMFVARPNGQRDAEAWLRDAAARAAADALVLDVRDDVPRTTIEALRTEGLLIATIDDPTDRRLAADLAFYPPIPQVDEFDWRGFTGALLVGGEWVVLRRAFAQPPERTPHSRPSVLVTMGGSDPAGMTLAVVDALALGTPEVMTDAFDLVIVLGPGFLRRAELHERLARTRRGVSVVEQPADIREIMLACDLAVASFGVTAYELAATQTPAVCLCLTEDHARSASVLETQGAATSLGVYTGAEGPRLAQTVRTLLADADRRVAMGRAGRALVDGGGAARVAEKILGTVGQSTEMRCTK